MFIKGHTSVDSYRKRFHIYNPKPLRPNTNAYAKFQENSQKTTS